MLARILFIVGLCCLALGGWLYYDSLPPPLCTIENAEREVEAKPGQEQEVIFTLTNPTNEMVKIVGLTGTCSVNGCLTPNQQAPIEVPPRSTYSIVCKHSVLREGEFRNKAHCYLADPHLREVVLEVSGEAK